jgi:hypothetical protein
MCNCECVYVCSFMRVYRCVHSCICICVFIHACVYVYFIEFVSDAMYVYTPFSEFIHQLNIKANIIDAFRSSEKGTTGIVANAVGTVVGTRDSVSAIISLHHQMIYLVNIH